MKNRRLMLLTTLAPLALSHLACRGAGKWELKMKEIGAPAHIQKVAPGCDERNSSLRGKNNCVVLGAFLTRKHPRLAKEAYDDACSANHTEACVQAEQFR